MTPSAEQQLAGFLAKFTPDMEESAKQALARLRKRMPTARQLVYDNYQSLVIGFGPSSRASEAVFSLVVFPDHLTLCFIRGAELADPDGILQGSGNQVRHIRLKTPADLGKRAVSKLMSDALGSARVPLPKTGGGMEVRAIAPKQRPRRPLGT